MVDPVVEKILRLSKLQLSSGLLSLYLSREGKDSPSSKDLLTIFHSLKHQNLSWRQRKLFRKDLERVERYLNGSFFDGRGKRSLVIFTAGNHLKELFEFEFFLPPQCIVSQRPYLDPIIKSMREHEKYLVLLADREKARLFTVHLGEIEEHFELFDEVEMVPQKVKAIKTEVGRDDKIPRHIEDHLHRHIKLIIKTMTDFAKDKNFQFIIIGGHKEIFEKIKKEIPYPYKSTIRGEFVTELNIPINDVFLKSKITAEEINKKLSQGRTTTSPSTLDW